MNHLSRSIEFDRPEYYRFTRDSGLPYGTFGKAKRPHPLWIISAIVLVALVAMFLVTR